MSGKQYELRSVDTDGFWTTESVKEEDLTDGQKDHLLGVLVFQFNDLPKEIQHRFLQLIIDRLKINTDKMFEQLINDIKI